MTIHAPVLVPDNAIQISVQRREAFILAAALSYALADVDDVNEALEHHQQQGIMTQGYLDKALTFAEVSDLLAETTALLRSFQKGV